MRWSIPDSESVLRSGCGEGIEDVGGSVAEASMGGGDVGAAAEPDDVDGGVAQGGHDRGGGRAVAKSPYTRLTSSNGPVDRLAPRVVRSRGADRLTVTSLWPRSHRRLAMQVVRPIGGSGGLTQPPACHRCRSDPGMLTLQ